MIGAATAIALNELGLAVTLVEHRPPKSDVALTDLPMDVRVSAINLASEALLTELGAFERISPTRKAPYQRLSCGQTGINTLAFDADSLGESQLGHIIENSQIQTSLWHSFSEQIQVESSLGKLLKITRGTDSTLSFEHGELTADCVIAADGAASHTRTLSGIGVTGWQYQQGCLGVLIKDTSKKDPYLTWQRFRPEGPIAYLPLCQDYASLIVYEPLAEIKKLAGLDNAALKQALNERFDLDFNHIEVLGKGAFPLVRQHANHYAKMGTVLVGDAAHAINPLAGQGVNLGFKDVNALRDALSEWVHERQSLEAAFASYEQSRRKDNLAMMSFMDACYVGFSHQVKPLQWLTERALRLAHRAGPLKTALLKHAIGKSAL